jgi:hypothetical protein
VDLPGNRKMRVGTPGLPDWACFNHDRYCFIEIKAPGRTPSQNQIDWMESARRSGLNSIWCDGLGRLMLELEQIWSTDALRRA